VIYFPPGKGDPRRQEKTNKLFLGIDHTAIAVAHTGASLRFYSDPLGFRKAGESENYGTEQEHLNQVFGAHLRITAMRAMSGPGIEFLEYLTPRDGRPRQHDAKANDLIHWQTTPRNVADSGVTITIEHRRINHVTLAVLFLTHVQSVCLAQLPLASGLAARRKHG
jgi:catechol 2,3-dioxygenase-like lactoylglutathione lyase family enzyme